MREWTNPPGVNAPTAHYSQVARSGNTLYISGQLGVDSSGQLVGAGDARAQARQRWATIAAISDHSGAPLPHLRKPNPYPPPPPPRPLVGEAGDELFPEPPYPPSTLVVVAALAEPQYLVEIEA